MNKNILVNRNDSSLFIVDMQEKMLPSIFEHHKLVQNCQWTLELAQDLEIPILGSEHYPQGLGPTVKPLLDQLSGCSFIAKKSFSCAGNEACVKALKDVKKKQVVMIGIEAHICVLQTAIEFLELQKEVFVVLDAVASRFPDDKTYALQRMRSAGIQIITREMLFFEWLRTSEDTQFKELRKKYIK